MAIRPTRLHLHGLGHEHQKSLDRSGASSVYRALMDVATAEPCLQGLCITSPDCHSHVMTLKKPLEGADHDQT